MKVKDQALFHSFMGLWFKESRNTEGYNYGSLMDVFLPMATKCTQGVNVLLLIVE